MLLTAFAAAYFTTGWLRQPTEYRYGGIACSEVKPLLPDYLAKKLDAELVRKIDVHLTECPDCRPMYRRMVKEMGDMAQMHHTPDSDQMRSRGREVVRGDPHQTVDTSSLDHGILATLPGSSRQLAMMRVSRP